MINRQQIHGLAETGIEIVRSSDAWLPDIFAVCYDILDSDDLWRTVLLSFLLPSREPSLLSDDEIAFRGRFSPRIDATKFRIKTLEVFTRIRDWAQAGPEPISDSLVRELAFLARSIDAQMLGLSLRSSSVVSSVDKKYWEHFRKKHNLLKNMLGRVVPKATNCPYGDSLEQFFSNLVRWPLAFDRLVDYRLVAGASYTGDLPRIGFVPVVHRKTELEWARHGEYCFTVKLNPMHEAAIVQRVVRALTWLADAETDIVILPELVSSSAIREAINDWLSKRAPRSPAW
jgi:hypothetical protein